MCENIIQIPDGTITSARGFSAGALYAGINKHSLFNLDVALLACENECSSAAVFTTNKVKAAPVLYCRSLLPSSSIRGLIVNSGNANACTGTQGLEDARSVAGAAATRLGVATSQILVMSTGVIGRKLPVSAIEQAAAEIELEPGGGHKFARAIMTTDTRPKEIALRVDDETGSYVIGGVAKGAGMICPNMATTLCFITTDAAVPAETLKLCVRRAAAVSFNMITVDGDMSPNDTLLIMANGASGSKPITPASKAGKLFQQALDRVCIYLARSVAADGEGATRLVTVNVSGAATNREAALAAKAIAGSNLVKSAIHGSDPNWGRIVSAAGRSGAILEESRLSLSIGETDMWQGGQILPFDLKNVSSAMSQPEVVINLDLGLGTGKATAWGCDLSEEYVTINSEYTT